MGTRGKGHSVHPTTDAYNPGVQMRLPLTEEAARHHLEHLHGTALTGHNPLVIAQDYHLRLHDEAIADGHYHTGPVPSPVSDDDAAMGWGERTLVEQWALIGEEEEAVFRASPVFLTDHPSTITITKGGQGCTWPWLWHGLVDRAGDEQHYIGLTRCAVQRKIQRARR